MSANIKDDKKVVKIQTEKTEQQGIDMDEIKSMFAHLCTEQKQAAKKQEDAMSFFSSKMDEMAAQVKSEVATAVAPLHAHNLEVASKMERFEARLLAMEQAAKANTMDCGSSVSSGTAENPNKKVRMQSASSSRPA